MRVLPADSGWHRLRSLHAGIVKTLGCVRDGSQPRKPRRFRVIVFAMFALSAIAGCEDGCGCGNKKKDPPPTQTTSSGQGCGGGSSSGGCEATFDSDGGRYDSTYEPPEPFDASRPDTSSTPDGAPWTCEDLLPSSFTCTPPEKRPGSKLCTDETIDALMSCFEPGSSLSGCSAAKKAHPDCATCMLGDMGSTGPIGWLDGNQVDTAACIRAIAPGDPCATVEHCVNTCVAETCGDCDTTYGSGSTEGSEFLDCRAKVLAPPKDPDVDADTAVGDTPIDGDVVSIDGDAIDGTVADVSDAIDEVDAVDASDDADAIDDADAGVTTDTTDAPDASEVLDVADSTDTAPPKTKGGQCWTMVAKDRPACIADPRFRPCYVKTKADLVAFYRGACRDGGSWTHAYESNGTLVDAGSSDATDTADASSDTMDASDATDAGASDAD